MILFGLFIGLFILQGFCQEVKNTKPLFQCYPNLEKKIPYISFGSFPTPIERLNGLYQITDFKNIYIKRDDLSGKTLKEELLFGGNKVRKLEFLFAKALEKDTDCVLTFGCIGSNHVVATAAYAHMLGLHTIAMLKPQSNSKIVQRNLLLMKFYGAEIHLSPNEELRKIQTIQILKEYNQKTGKFPFIIPTGGSTPLGTIGFVNAAFELKNQINEKILPEPDQIYLPGGSWGSAVGLLLGIKATGLKTKIIIIAVEPENKHNQFKNYIHNLFAQTNYLLHSYDATFPLVQLSDKDFTIIYNFSGNEYGQLTKEARLAKKIMKKQEHLYLDTTYTAKTIAAMLNDLQNINNKDLVILYWYTFCANSFEKQINKIHYTDLPSELHSYFEKSIYNFTNKPHKELNSNFY